MGRGEKPVNRGQILPLDTAQVANRDCKCATANPGRIPEAGPPLGRAEYVWGGLSHSVLWGSGALPQPSTGWGRSAGLKCPVDIGPRSRLSSAQASAPFANFACWH